MQHTTRRRFVSLISLLSGLTLAGSAVLAHAAGEPQVLLKTNMGDIKLELYPEKAPKSVENFLRYVKKGQYNGTIFHRVIGNFMIQGGGFDNNMKEKPTANPIENKSKKGLKQEACRAPM